MLLLIDSTADVSCFTRCAFSFFTRGAFSCFTLGAFSCFTHFFTI